MKVFGPHYDAKHTGSARQYCYYGFFLFFFAAKIWLIFKSVVATLLRQLAVYLLLPVSTTRVIHCFIELITELNNP